MPGKLIRSHRRKHGKRSFKNGPYGKPYYDRKSYAMWRAPRPLMPSEYVTNLRYTAIQSFNWNGIYYNHLYFQTSPYDVDPTLGNTACPGLAQFAAFYARVRPLRMTYKFDVCNNEAFPVFIASGFTSEVLVTPDVDVAGNPLWKKGVLAAKGGQDRLRMKDSRTIVAIAGTKQALYDDLYTSSTTSDTLQTPGTNYAYLVCESDVTGTGAGVTVSIQITLTVQFYRSKVFNT